MNAAVLNPKKNAKPATSALTVADWLAYYTPEKPVLRKEPRELTILEQMYAYYE